MTLWMPSELTARQCHKWLGENVPDIDPRRDYERQRVQQIIDSRLTRRKILPLDSISKDTIELPDADVVASVITEQINAEGLAEAVASAQNSLYAYLR